MKVVTGRFWAVILLAAVLGLAAAADTGRAAAADGKRSIVEHTVLAGDNLMLLAGYYYKDPRQWKQIYRENTAVLKDPHLLLPGTVLRVATTDFDRWHIPYEEFAARAGR